jgi:hypothetical protein
MSVQKTVPVTLFLLIALSSCGKDPSSDKSEELKRGYKVGDMIPSRSEVDRTEYCVAYADRESDEEVKKEFLRELSASWTHVIAHNNHRTFWFAPGSNYVMQRAGTQSPKEEMTYRKLCLSKPLDETYGALAGYRLLEFMAANNEGGATMAARFEKAAETSKVTLHLTEHSYFRWAANEDLRSMSTVLTNKNIYAYPIRRQ